MKSKKVEEENIKKEEIKKKTRKAQIDTFLSYMPYIIVVVFIVIIRVFIATPVRVDGTSMYPTLNNNDYMILYKLTKKLRGVERFDIVVLSTDSGRLVKRVVGLPGDKIKYAIEKNKNGKEIGVLYINSKPVEEKFLSDSAKVNTCSQDWLICEKVYEVPEGEYFVMGDNRGNSIDSRMIGTIKYDNIIGITKLRIFPFNKMGNVK